MWEERVAVWERYVPSMRRFRRRPKESIVLFVKRQPVGQLQRPGMQHARSVQSERSETRSGGARQPDLTRRVKDNAEAHPSPLSFLLSSSATDKSMTKAIGVRLTIRHL